MMRNQNNADRLYTYIISNNSRYNNKWETVLLCFYRAHCERKLQDSVKFFQPQPELVLKLFLILGQSEPQC